MPRVVSNKHQLERLAALMEENTDLARGLCSKAIAKGRWEKIGRELNSFGPPNRSSDAWQRVWNDLKYKTKKKSAHNHAETLATGGGPNTSVPLSNLEETVNRLMNYTTYHHPPGDEFGMEVQYQAENIAEVEALSDNEVPVECRTPKRKAISQNADKQIALLERQTNEQAEFQKETLKAFNDIKKSLCNIEATNKKKYYLKKEKLAIYKQEVENKNKARLAKLEVKKNLLELKRDMYNQRL